jgi:hypothetical protein
MLTGAEKINVLKFMSQTHRNIHEGRIKRELQVVITTLSFYGASLALKMKLSRPFPTDIIFTIVVWVAFIGIAVGVYIYMKTSGDANRYNQRQAEVSEEKLIEILNGSGINIAVKADHPCANRWIWQALIVFFGAVITSFVITYF